MNPFFLQATREDPHFHGSFGSHASVMSVWMQVSGEYGRFAPTVWIHHNKSRSARLTCIRVSVPLFTLAPS